MIKTHINTLFRMIVIVLLLLLQLFIIIMLPIWLKEHAIIVYFLIELISMIMLLVMIADNTNSTYKIFWIMIILLLPVSGHIMYELWGKEGTNRKQHRIIQNTMDYYKSMHPADELIKENLEKQGIEVKKISEYLNNNGYPAYENTQIKYFEIGENAFESLIVDLEKAQKFIFISFFTIADGVLWDRICEILIKKANSNVEIKIMYDDAGSIFQLSEWAIKRLNVDNIEVMKFNAIEKNLHRQYFQYRNHQKIIVIDGNISYTGGINISDRYANINSPYGHWKDVAIRLEGEATWGLSLIFLGMWDKNRNIKDLNKYKPLCNKKNNVICQPYADGPANNPDNPARDMYHLMANMASKELFIMTPYLILDDETRDCLCLAAKSGVNIKIITPGVPDKKSVKLLTEWNYGELLKAGIHIYEYVPGFIHAKVCVNDTSCFVGTVNMDYRSFYLHYECGVWFCNDNTKEKIKDDFYETLSLCKEITLEEWNKRPITVRMIQIILNFFKSQF